jgi:L-amino acid N-acyltransferase YncA
MVSPNSSNSMILIRPMANADAAFVLSVLAEGIEDGQATFEISCPEWPVWDENHLAEGRLVAVIDGRIAGWAALSPVSKRACYRGVAEVSVYIARNARGRGLGRRLLDALIEESERSGIWTLQGVSFEDNAASLALQAACGFRVVGRRERIAQRHGRWKSTVLTERRSRKVGV